MILYVFGGIYMKKLRVTLTSLGVAAGILVGGYTIVNRVPVNGLSVGNPITNDDIKNKVISISQNYNVCVIVVQLIMDH